MGDVTQLIESLPSMYKALGSTPGTLEISKVAMLVTPNWLAEAGGSDVHGYQHRTSCLSEKRAMHGGALGRQRQEDFCELKTSLVYTVSSRPVKGCSPCLQIHR